MIELAYRSLVAPPRCEAIGLPGSRDTEQHRRAPVSVAKVKKHASRNVERPTSVEFSEFEQALERLNNSYWLTRVAGELAGIIPPDTRLRTLIPADVAAHLDVSAGELRRIVPEAEIQARYSMLVQAITAYEDYLAKALTSLMTSKIKTTKQYSVKFRLADIPTPLTLDYLKSLAVEVEVKSVVDARYSERASAIKKLLQEHGLQPPALDAGVANAIARACEIRNCIIHAGGAADSRAIAELQPVFPNLTLGEHLPLDERILWKHLGALRKGAQAVEAALHPVVPKKPGGRAVNRKKKWQPGSKHPDKSKAGRGAPHRFKAGHD